MNRSTDTVVVDDTGIRCHRADGWIDAVSWSDLRLVGVETNDAGPFLEDVHFYVEGPSFGFYIPQSAEGTDELTRRFDTLPGFDNQALPRRCGRQKIKDLSAGERPPTAIGPLEREWDLLSHSSSVG